jgi:hypothetical protein
MVDRYAKFSTENLSVAASRIENGWDANVIQLSRFWHSPKARGQRQSTSPIFNLAHQDG